MERHCSGNLPHTCEGTPPIISLPLFPGQLFPNRGFSSRKAALRRTCLSRVEVKMLYKRPFASFPPLARDYFLPAEYLVLTFSPISARIDCASGAIGPLGASSRYLW